MNGTDNRNSHASESSRWARPRTATSLSGARPIGFRAAAAVLGVPPRREIVAAAELLDLAAAGKLSSKRLLQWFDEHCVEPFDASQPLAVYEHGVGAVALNDVTERGEVMLARLVQTACQRALAAVRGLVSRPPRDGFVVAALVQGRVRRDSMHGTYVPTLSGVEALSDILLAFFAADLLDHREEYEACLTVCDACGRVSLSADATNRRACPIHEPAP